MAKATKAEANYRLGGAHCHACVHFIEAADEKASEAGKNKCHLVAGDIDEHQVCDWFKRGMSPTRMVIGA